MSLMLTVDDLGLMHRELGIWLPGFALDAEAVTHRDDPDIEAVAVVVESFADAVLAVEVVADRSGAVTEYAFSLGASGERSLLEAMPRGLVRCAAAPGDPVATIADIAGMSLVRQAADGPVWTVDANAYRRCDELANAGDAQAAVEVLTSAGVAEPTAKTWVATLNGHGSAAVITAVKRDPGSGRLEAGELRWLCGERGEAWRITADDTATLLTPVDGQQLLAALEEMVNQ